jgi:dihydrofolate reductase
VIGGAQLYVLALPLAGRILATEVHADVPGDVFFPELPAGLWRETARQTQAPENGYAYDFVTYERM